MRVKIYQINNKRDTNNVKFEGMDTLEKFQGTTKIDASLYDEVFNGEVEWKGLEALYTLFNMQGHPLHRGHSMSVSDVTVTEEGAFFCDSVGFKKIDFDESLTQKPEGLMRAVYIEPGRPAFETEVRHELEAWQRSVGGLVEPVYLEKGIALLCNEEAKLMGMPGNRRIGSSVLAGPILVVGDTGSDFRSLTEEEAQRMVNRFAMPEEITQEEVQADMGFTFVPL